MRSSIFFFLFFIAVKVAFSQIHYSPEQIQHISIEAGLSQSTVYSIFQDGKGFLWFGTADGLNRYDGYEFKTFRNNPADSNSISNNTIRCIAEDKDGNLYFGTEKGINIFLSKENKFTSSKLSGDLLKEKIFSIFLDDDKIVAGTASGISFYNYDLSLRKSFNLKSQVNVIYKDKEGSLWAGSGLSGIFRFNKKTSQFENKYFVKNLPVQGIFERKDKSLYFIIKKEGLVKFSYLNNKFTRILNEGNFTSGFLKNRSDTLWLGSYSGDILLFNLKREKVENHLKLPGKFPGNTSGKNSSLPVSSFYIDRSNILWIGLDGNGIYKFNLNKEKFGKFIDADSGNDLFEGVFIKSIYKDENGLVWIGTYNKGIMIYDFNKKKIKHAESKIFQNVVAYSINQFGKDTLIIGTDHGIFILKNNLRVIKHLTPTTEILSIKKGSSGKIWFSNGRHLSSIDKNRFTINSIKFNFDEIGYYPLQIISTSSNGKLWLGFLNAGLIEYNPASKKSVRYSFDPKNLNGISNNNIRAIYNDKGRNCLWIGTENGLNQFDKNKKTFKRYYEKDGLPNGFIYAILPDKKGKLWISTNKGISRFSPEEEKFRNYGIEDGLQSYEFNTGAFFKDDKGYLFFGGINGLNYFHPDSVYDNYIKPKTAIVGIKKFDIPFEPGEDVSSLKELKLDYETTVFSIQFSALEFTNPQKNIFAYRMLGFENKWNFAGRKREARYTNLDPGEYIFEVKAANNDGVWNEIPARLKITIIPPFYEIWWFKLGVFVLVLILIAVSVRFFELQKIKKRIKKLEEKEALEKERVRIARDIHDEVGANLTRISLLSGIPAAKENITSYSSTLENISESVNETIVKLDEIVWAVNPKNDNLKNLIAYICEYTESFFESSEIVYRFDIPETIPEITLTSEKRHNFFLTVKEALNNIQRYSEAEVASISMKLEKSFFTFSIKDDGKGFNLNLLKESSNGIKNMKERINSIGGEFFIFSKPAEGTEIQLKIYIE